MVVAVVTPHLGLGLSGPQVLEQLTVQELIADLRVEALDVPVLPGTPACALR